MAATDFITGVAQTPQSKQGGATPLSLTETGCLRVSVTEPEGVDYTRNGSRFYLGNNAACTGIAPVQALVTTAAQWAITNPSSSSKAMVFDLLGLWLISGTAGTTGNVCAYSMFTAPAQSGLTAGVAIASCDGSGNSSLAACKSGVTITTPAAPVWMPISGNESLGSAVDSLVMVDSEVRGRIILPPGNSLGLAAFGATGTTPLFAPIARWYEVPMTNL